MAAFQVAVLVLFMVVNITALPAVPYGQASSSSYGHAVPAYGSAYEGPYEERNYKLYYLVKDDPSYNYQTRNEQKNGNTVTGQYTVLEPTGELRVVNYVADDYGFRADVKNQAGYGPGYPTKVSAPSYG